jgi:hypothetical protein
VASAGADTLHLLNGGSLFLGNFSSGVDKIQLDVPLVATGSTGTFTGFASGTNLHIDTINKKAYVDLTPGGGTAAEVTITLLGSGTTLAVGDFVGIPLEL